MRRATGFRHDDGTLVCLMLVEFAHAAAAEEAPHRREHRIQARDGWQCAMPHCRSRSGLHGHHIRFRSHGGPDDDWNLITLCAGCHRLLHDGKVAIRGTAPLGLTIFVGRYEDGSPREVYRAA